MRLVAQYETSFPYFDKKALIESNGTEHYESTRASVMYERRRLVGFLSRKQHLRKCFRLRKGFRGVIQYAYDVKGFYAK